MKSAKKDSGGPRDIISGLPDAMICHILSFLPTKEAASTSVLAKRWKPLLAFVPNLHFDDSSCFHPAVAGQEKRKSFMHFVDSVLDLQEKANTHLRRFHVKCEDALDQHQVLSWISKVLKRGVSDIDLSISSSSGYCSNSRFYPLPSKIFASKTLVRLKIEFVDGVNVHLEGDVSLPKLKILHLDYFRIKTSMFNKLLSGCNALEELVLINLLWDESSKLEPSSVTVSIPTLKRLKFCRSEDFYEAGDSEEGEEFAEAYEIFMRIKILKKVSLSFENPNLVYLEYSDNIGDKYQQVSFDSLVEASLELRKIHDVDKMDITKLLMGISNVKILYLSACTLRVLGCCPETIPVFENLVLLTIDTAFYIEWTALPTLLKNCPHLQTLIFEGLHHKYTEKCEEEDGCLCEFQDDWGMKEEVHDCLLSSPVKVLKILKFGDISDDEEDLADQIEHVKHFLETMPDLEQMILYYDTPEYDEDVMEVSEKLQKLPRVASAKCHVQIISENISLSFTVSAKQGTCL